MPRTRYEVRCTLRRVTLIAVAIPVARPDGISRALDHARDAKAHGADMVEWRVDALAESDEGIAAVARLLKESPLPSIVTVRATSEGGAFDGDDESRIRAWKKWASVTPPPAYIDVELSALRDSPDTRAFLASAHKAWSLAQDSPRVILSFHDFRGRPPGLSGKVAEIWADQSAAVGKVVWTARTERDNLEAFELLRSRAKPTIALCMGEHGLMTRVLAPKFGGFLTYARCDDHGTAPGQPTVRELIEEWGFRSIDGATEVFGVLGYPVAHSKSPATHNGWFKDAKINARMFRISVAPMWEAFKATLGELLNFKGLDFSGAAVTAPHKVNALRYITEAGGSLDVDATRVGAVNTIVRSAKGALRGMNTDVGALVEVLGAAVGSGGRPRDLAGSRALVIGAGGAARAAVEALASEGASVMIINRTDRHAKALAQEYSTAGRAKGAVVAHSSAHLERERFDLVLNCTSVGMQGGTDPDGDPLPAGVALDKSMLVFDAVYAPSETALLRRAAAQGARTVGGDAMFMAQARAQFKAWTGKLPKNER
ncbi:MAG: type I 3-dehydroquinate dehydratase [Phycisphaerales bacterium]|nr:type I 3-dehydroquinate dehydratase [Phycisphaerales bacterium]